MGDLAGSVTDDLHLDVACVRHEFLDVERARSESLLCFRCRTGERFAQIGDTLHRPHAATTATCYGLQHHGAARAQAFEKGPCLIERHGVAESRLHWYTAAFRQGSREGLVAEPLQRLDTGPHKCESGVFAGFRKGGDFAEESVARMHGVATGLFRKRDDSCGIEIGRNPDGTEFQRQVGMARVQRLTVILGIDGYRRYAQVRGGTGYADGDFAAIGDKQALKHLSLVPPGRIHSKGIRIASCMPEYGKDAMVCQGETHG